MVAAAAKDSSSAQILLAPFLTPGPKQVEFILDWRTRGRRVVEHVEPRDSRAVLSMRG